MHELRRWVFVLFSSSSMLPFSPRGGHGPRHTHSPCRRSLLGWQWGSYQRSREKRKWRRGKQRKEVLEFLFWQQVRGFCFFSGMCLGVLVCGSIHTSLSLTHKALIASMQTVQYLSYVEPKQIIFISFPRVTTAASLFWMSVEQQPVSVYRVYCIIKCISFQQLIDGTHRCHIPVGSSNLELGMRL